MATVALDASPVNVLRSLRGSIIAARLAYPEVLHLEMRDSAGGTWQLATQDAEYFSADPGELVARSVENAEIDPATGELRLRLSNDEVLMVAPAQREALDDPPNWELITPNGLALEFGPGMRWQISSADARLTPAA
jgi:hypothetical protein